jgi:hypothetical protein
MQEPRFRILQTFSTHKFLQTIVEALNSKDGIFTLLDRDQRWLEEFQGKYSLNVQIIPESLDIKSRGTLFAALYEYQRSVPEVLIRTNHTIDSRQETLTLILDSRFPQAVLNLIISLNSTTLSLKLKGIIKAAQCEVETVNSPELAVES